MKILLIQLKRIGDLILTTPAVHALRQQFPTAEISLVVAGAGRELLPAIPEIDHGIAMRGSVADSAKWLGVATRSFDVCVDFTHNDRSAFLTLVSKARRRITATHVELQSKIRARSYNELVACPVRTMHTIDYHLALLEPLEVRGASRDIRLQLPDTAMARANDTLRAAGVTRDFVLLHPGSARAEKFWDVARWAELIDQLHAHHELDCVISGAGSGMEREHILQIKGRTKAPVIDLSGRTDLLTLAATVKRARLLVTVDSAPMHFAAGFATPQVALFGPTNPFHWRPLSESALVLQGESASPQLEFAPKQRRATMNLISTRAVVDAMESLLSAPAASRL